ncbi:MAG: GatB/YqeY domain-containing protein [Clostridia bacterium]|nr:GatB/YqeY domain-containing protein [Clostridia bacterium]
MTLENLQKDMIAAMKAKDKVRKDAVSSLIAAVKKYGIDNGVRNDITEEMTNAVILKELKTAKEQLDTCPKDRTDLIEEYTVNYEIIKEYAPKLLSEEEVKAILTEKFADVIATKNKGMIMKTVMASLKGKADGKVINAVVAELCE